MATPLANAGNDTHVSTPIRIDIQALRGFAVLVVVLYHSNIGPFSGGYLGVDIFFVVSGFLITSLVAAGIDQGTLQLRSFYFRRAKRLLPSAYLTIFFTILLAPWFLNHQEMKDFAAQVIGAVTFSGNFVLWQQTGYFEGASDLKPLLHVWSLAIEEQYYFILPVALVLLRRSYWLPTLIAALFVSAILCGLGVFWKPVATFYLLPTRAWELLVGSVGAIWQMNRRRPLDGAPPPPVVKHLFIPSLVCLLALPCLPSKGVHPGLDAVLVCASTLVVILRKSDVLNSSNFAKLLARVGDISYSLYLVHWPVIALMKNAWFGSLNEPPVQLRIIAMVLSFLLAYLLYRFVENPIRQSPVRISSKIVGTVALSSLMLSVLPLASIMRGDQARLQEARRSNYGLSSACDYQNSFFLRTECQKGNKPNILVWGDSYAMHLVPGLVRDIGDRGIVQATRSQCGPIVGLAPRNLSESPQGTSANRSWAESCIEFNSSVLDYLRTAHSIDIVVLSSPFAQYLNVSNRQHIVRSGTGFLSVPVDEARVVSAMTQTIHQIRATGKRVVLIAPPPSSGFDIGGCLERKISNAITMGAREDCQIDQIEYLEKHKDVLRFLDAVTTVSNVGLIRFDPFLCSSNLCEVMLDDIMLYRDAGHLSYSGSELLGRKMQLMKQVGDLAR